MASRALLRPSLRTAGSTIRLTFTRRLESTASQKAAEAAKDTAGKAKEYQAKASEGLSRVTSAAGPAISGAAGRVAGALSGLGGPVGRMMGFVERQTPFVIYYSRVAFETGKLVFQGQKMSPPSMATFQSYYNTLWQSIQNRTIMQSPTALIQQARTMSTPQLVAGGVVFAECLGFFTVGEMIGRFKLVGYHGEAGAHH